MGVTWRYFERLTAMLRPRRAAAFAVSADAEGSACRRVKLADGPYSALEPPITWTGTLKIKNKSGTVVEIGAPHNGAHNTKLHAVGATYGVKKLLTDAPHWSIDGH